MMPSLDHLESRLRNTTALTNVNDDKAAKSAWATSLKSEDVKDENDGMCPKMEQPETLTVVESKSEVDSFVPGNSKMEEMIAA